VIAAARKQGLKDTSIKGIWGKFPVVINTYIRELSKTHIRLNPAPTGMVNAQVKAAYDQSLQYLYDQNCVKLSFTIAAQRNWMMKCWHCRLCSWDVTSDTAGSFPLIGYMASGRGTKTKKQQVEVQHQSIKLFYSLEWEDIPFLSYNGVTLPSASWRTKVQMEGLPSNCILTLRLQYLNLQDNSADRKGRIHYKL